MECARVENPVHAVNVGDTKVDMKTSDNAYMPGVLVITGSIPNNETAEAVNDETGRKHLIVSSLVNIITYILDGTLSDRITAQNR